MEDEEKMNEAEKRAERWKRWFDRLQGQYAELDAETKELRKKVADLTRERDGLLGDVTKLTARVAELEAKLPQEPTIILP